MITFWIFNLSLHKMKHKSQVDHSMGLMQVYLSSQELTTYLNFPPGLREGAMSLRSLLWGEACILPVLLYFPSQPRYTRLQLPIPGLFITASLRHPFTLLWNWNSAWFFRVSGLSTTLSQPPPSLRCQPQPGQTQLQANSTEGSGPTPRDTRSGERKDFPEIGYKGITQGTFPNLLFQKVYLGVRQR